MRTGVARTCLAIMLAAASACDGAGESGSPAGGAGGVAGGAGGVAGSSSASPQRPPQGQGALEAWLAEGHYKSWRCEASISAARLNGAHGRHRICWNDLVVGSSSGTYPAGAASVKELFDPRDLPAGFAVGLKIREGAGHDTWYWYERTGTSPRNSPVADGVAVKVCGPDCHAAAPRDNVYIRPP